MPDNAERGAGLRKRRRTGEEIERDARVGLALQRLRIATVKEIMDDTGLSKGKVDRSLKLNMKESVGRITAVEDPTTGGGYCLTEAGRAWISRIAANRADPPVNRTATKLEPPTPLASEPRPITAEKRKQGAIPEVSATRSSRGAQIESKKRIDRQFLEEVEARIGKKKIRLVDEFCDTFVDNKEALLARGPPANEEEDLIYRAAEMLGRLMENAHLGFWYFKADPRTLRELLDQVLGVAMKSDPTKPYILNVRDFTLDLPRDILFLNAAGFARGAIEILADMGLRPEGIWEERLNKIATALDQRQTLSYIAYPYNEFMTIGMNPRGPRAYFVPLTARMEDGQRVFKVKSRPVGLLKKMIEPVRFPLPYQDKTVKMSRN